MSTAEQDIHTTTVVQLTVVEGVGMPRGAAYASPLVLEMLECAAGDVVQIRHAQSNRTTVARFYPWPGDDSETSVANEANGQSIAMEGLVRQNAGAALGDTVNVSRTTAQPAVSAALVPVNGTVALNDAEL